MKSILAHAAAILSLTAANPAVAALAVGDPAPDFAAEGTQDGKGIIIALSELRKIGPVVVFFFPSAFTDALECREFAENIERFRAARVSVVGMSRDSVETLSRFSSAECASKFPLASASESLVNAFDVNDGAMFNSRTTYVIAPSGMIAYSDNDAEYGGHVKNVLAFVEGLKR